MFALITSEKRPSGRANLGGSASSRDRFDYKSLLLIMPGSKVCHSVRPRDKRKQCMVHLSPRGSPPPAGPTWGRGGRGMKEERGEVWPGAEVRLQLVAWLQDLRGGGWALGEQAPGPCLGPRRPEVCEGLGLARPPFTMEPGQVAVFSAARFFSSEGEGG